MTFEAIPFVRSGNLPSTRIVGASGAGRSRDRADDVRDHHRGTGCGAAGGVDAPCKTFRTGPPPLGRCSTDEEPAAGPVRTRAGAEVHPRVAEPKAFLAADGAGHGVGDRERVLDGLTADLASDAGMCGDYDSVIGMEKLEPLRRFITGMASARFEPANGPATLSGVYVETDDRTGKAVKVRMIGRKAQVASAGASSVRV